MKKWLAGGFVLLLLVGTCSKEDEGAAPESAALQGSSEVEDPTRETADTDAEARQARKEARRRRLVRERGARERRARERRQAARERAAIAALADEPDPEPAEPSCNTNYSGACLKPDSADYDCDGGSGDGPDYTGLVQVVGTDEYDLDRDGDGIACDT
jgi:hypothetical protein